MANLSIITGPSGVGKSTISKRISNLKAKSALIEGDSIYHQVVGGYVPAWKEGNHLETFWDICLNSIKVYLESGYDVVFNYIINPDKIALIEKKFNDYIIKFVVLMVDEKTLLGRDQERPDDCQMKDRCIHLLNSFKNKNYDSKYILDTSNLSIDETIDIIEKKDRFIINNEHSGSSKLIFSPNIPELSVTNLKNSIEFYKLAGFRVEYDRPENKFAFISLGAIQFMLQEISDNDKWDIAPLSYPFGNGINFQLEVNNIDAIYNSFKNSNHKISFDIEENWYRQDDKLLGNKEFLIQDPDGYLLRFAQDLGEREC